MLSIEDKTRGPNIAGNPSEYSVNRTSEKGMWKEAGFGREIH